MVILVRAPARTQIVPGCAYRSVEVDIMDESRPVPPHENPLPEQIMYKWAFDLVAPKGNWKTPINTKVDAPTGREDRELFKKMIARAVMFYTGSVALIVDIGDKQIAVVADGYYKAIGA
jgi:hypothetical protein